METNQLLKNKGVIYKTKHIFGAEKKKISDGYQEYTLSFCFCL